MVLGAQSDIQCILGRHDRYFERRVSNQALPAVEACGRVNPGGVTALGSGMVPRGVSKLWPARLCAVHVVLAYVSPEGKPPHSAGTLPEFLRLPAIPELR